MSGESAPASKPPMTSLPPTAAETRREPGPLAMTRKIRAAVEAHEPDRGDLQWYVDEHCIDVDAAEFWLVVGRALAELAKGSERG